MSIVQPGMLTTVQDLGRHGARRLGVPLGGAVDSTSMLLANLAVGNIETAAGLECTLVGPRLKFSRDSMIAVAGAMVEGVEPMRPTLVRAGKTVSLERLSRGCRAYVAVAGGINVPIVLGGRGTELRSGFGGLNGRALRRGDVLPIGDLPAHIPADCRIDPQLLGTGDTAVRFIAGRDFASFSPSISDATFRVSPQSDRMGVRLNGMKLQGRFPTYQHSFAVAPGAIQVPPSGEPVVLLGDAQTIGGYPVVAHVISVDLGRVAQLRPRQTIRFAEVSIDAAIAAAVERQRLLSIVRAGLAGARRWRP